MKLNVNLGLIFFLSGSNVRENCCTFINDTPFELMLDWHVKWKLERKHSSWLISVEMAFLVVRLTLTTHRIGRSNGGQRLNLTWVRLSLFNGLGLRGRFSPCQRCRRHLMTCSLALNCHCLENAENESNSKKKPQVELTILNAQKAKTKWLSESRNTHLFCASYFYKYWEY